MNLQHRQLVPELMDDPDLDPAQHQQALAGLRRINWWCGTSAKLAAAIAKLCEPSLQRLRLLDIGSGGGDIAAGVFRKLRAYGWRVDLEGWDISGTAVRIARDRYADDIVSTETLPESASGKAIDDSSADPSRLSFHVADALQPAREAEFDFVYCSLFLHHFEATDAARLLQAMYSQARRAVIVDDLDRTVVGYCLAQFGCRVLSRSPIVHFDGPQSVRAAFRPQEVQVIASECGLPSPKIVRHWPQRYMLIWRKS